MICGVDEAGRGPVLGDLVVAGVACPEDAGEDLLRMGVKDSKLLSPGRRQELFSLITSRYSYEVVTISPGELDKLMSRYSLNAVEAHAFAEIINRLKPAKAYLDCADVLPRNFRRHLSPRLTHRCALVIEHRADERYPVVAAGSVVAKVLRDRSMSELRRVHGDIGSGYPSDPKTIAFLNRCRVEGGSFPSFVRRSWKPASRAANLSLDDF